MAVFSIIKSSSIPENKRIDAEYFQPKYLDFYKIIEGWDILGDYIEPPINGDDIRTYDDNGERLYIRTGDIDFEGLHLDKIKKISPNNILKVNIRINDVLFTRKGNYGKSAVATDDILGSAISSEIMLLRLKSQKISPFYLNAFLNSRYGQFQIERNIHGVSNFSITQDDVIKLQIILLPDIYTRIDKLIKDSIKFKFSIDNLYKEAELELLERMVWGKLETKHVLDYKTTSKVVCGSNRIDPEFYQPKFINLTNHLDKMGSKKIGDFCSMPNRGVQPLYDVSGEIVVINSKHLSTTVIDTQVAEKTTEQFYNESTTEKARLKKHDVLMYSTGAYVGRTNVYLEDSPGIASNHVSIIRPNKKVCNPLYLALFLNSQAGLMQTDQRASGSAQREIYPQDIVKYDVFIPVKNKKPDLEWQEKLANKIIKAHEAKKQARQKLQEAKEIVEREIEILIKK